MTPTPTLVVTTDWKTYSNTKYLYSFKCPPTSTHTVELSSGNGKDKPLYQEVCYEGNNSVRVYVYPSSSPAVTEDGAFVKAIASSTGKETIYFRGFDELYYSQVLSTFNSTIPTPTPTISQIPSGWTKRPFPAAGLFIYAPTDWKSDIQLFPEVPSKLIRFWQGSTPDTATVQLNIKNNWENMSGQYEVRNFKINETLSATKVDPPKMNEKTLDRYQTQYAFEKDGKVYSLSCVHNWITSIYSMCETMLKTIEFTPITP